MGCSSSKSSDVRHGSIPGGLRGIRRRVALPSGGPARRGHGKGARKVHQNADVQQQQQQQPALWPASWPELNVLLCKLKQETPMFNAATTLREIMNRDDTEDRKIEPPLNTRRTMSVSVIHTVEDVDAAMRKASEKTRVRDDLAVDYRGDSGAPVFDPETSDAFESAAEEVSDHDWAQAGAQPTTVGPEKLLERFECRCPPDGERKAVLYTTSLRGIRKTYEDCERARVIVESYGVSVDERDVSMHSGFLRELKSLTERGAVVPKLFIRGKYVGGADEIADLHDDGELGGLLGGLPRGRKSCDGCGGLHFFPCVKCNGSCKVVAAQGGFEVSRCSDCNENGLVRCPLCSSSSSPSRPV